MKLHERANDEEKRRKKNKGEMWEYLYSRAGTYFQLVNNDRWDVDGTMPRKGKYQQFIRTIYRERNNIEFLGLIWRPLQVRIIF